MTFIPFPKVPRYSREVVVTEKIDGTNASVLVMSGREYMDMPDAPPPCKALIGAGAGENDVVLLAGSRNRWITPEKDNFGFAAWVRDNAEGLVKLGPGRHFGEWFGAGIQRRYGLTEKRFSLFNVAKWGHLEVRDSLNAGPPCHVVPTLWRGNMDSLDVPALMDALKEGGSVAVPGFMDPEGLMIFHEGSRQTYKKTYAGDAMGKERMAA